MQAMLQKILSTCAIGMAIYHAISSQYLYFGQWEHQTVHLAFIFTLTFLSYMVKPQALMARILTYSGLALGLAGCIYVYTNLAELELTQGFPTDVAVWIGCGLILAAMVGTYLSWGAPLLFVAGFFVAYFFWGHLLDGPLYHAKFSFPYVISFLSVGLSGMYGMFLSLSADQVFLFVLFGSMLTAFKVDALFMELGKVMGRLMRGGPGMTAVISNGLIGMVSGAPVASAAITGPFVLPYMKKSGYETDEAAGIVACAATGSQLMPPVMGAAAFLMATFIGQPYSVVMLVAILPAVCFYLSVGLGVQCMAVAKGTKIVQMDVNWGIINRRIWVFVLPIGLIFVMLLMRYSPAMTAFWACVVAIVVGFARKETRPTLGEFAKALQDGAIVGAKIGISLVLIGLVAQTLISTGMGSKLAQIIHYIADGKIYLGLIATMLVALVLGCAVPPTAAYALCAIVVVPTLTQMGVGLLSAHMYCFYFAIISAVTPPVGLASLAASGIAGGNYWKTSIHAFKLSLIGFMLPYMIVYNPIFSFDTSNIMWFCTSFVTLMISIICIAGVLYGALIQRMKPVEYALCILSIALCMWHIFDGGAMHSTLVLGVAAAAGACLGMTLLIQKSRGISEAAVA